MVRLTTNTVAFATFLLSQSVLAAPAMTTCPTKESIKPANGRQYAICQDSDYQRGGKSLQLLRDCASTDECFEICVSNARCNKAVYDKKNKICHVKDDAKPTNWVADDQFDSIRIVQQSTATKGDDKPASDIVAKPLARGTFIAKCHEKETTYRGLQGEVIRACSGTDYVGPSERIIQNCKGLNACASYCSLTKTCRKAVWDRVNNVCHLKAAEPKASLFWEANEQFTAIRVDETNPTDPARLGKWSDVIRLPLIPVAAYVVPQFPQPDKMLFFSAWGKDTFGGPAGYTQFGEYNLVTGDVSSREVAETHHDMFCPAISALEDGRIVIQGGSDAEAVSIYDPATNKFTRGPDLKVARGYQTSTLLSNGKIFTIGGAYSGKREGKNGEVYDPVADNWTYLPDANVKPILTTDHEGIWREDNHAWLFGWKNGSVFQAGPSMEQHWYGTDGTGSVKKAGVRDANDDAMCGMWAMYDAVAGKIFSAGGSPDYTNSDATTRAHITTIGEAFTDAQVEQMPDMNFPRGFGNMVVLPDGTLLVTGGQRRSVVFTNTDGILVPELFDPKTKKWTQLAAEAIPRNYHSVSILLPDGTVFSGGGGLCYVSKVGGDTSHCDRDADHADGQIFSPPYLFNDNGSMAARPVISSVKDEVLQAGDELKLTMSAAAENMAFSLVRIGSVTHSVNSDQRRIPLDVVIKGKDVVAKLPADNGILLPGYYYLFAMTSRGTPSMARSIQVVL